MKPLFDDNGHAKRAGNILCYYYDHISGEYLGWSDEHVPVGVSLPGDCTTVKPSDDAPGKVSLWDGTSWTQHPDHRGQVAYDTTNGQPITVNYIGEIVEGFTLDKPSTPYDKWNGEAWATDDAVRIETERDALLTSVNGHINSRQWPGKAAIGRLKGDELTEYNVWLDYLDALESSNGNPWPQRPEA